MADTSGAYTPSQTSKVLSSGSGVMLAGNKKKKKKKKKGLIKTIKDRRKMLEEAAG
jgi:hypothetical protein